MTLPKVSVIIPTYNRAHLLPRAINSVLNQTFQDFELIIVDDGSTDNTEEVVKGFNDKRIIYLKRNKNKGPSAARNTGIKSSRGKYIALLDADDEWLPEKLGKQIELFKKSPFSEKLGFVSCHGIATGDKRKTIYKVPNYRGNISKEILGSPFIFCPISVILKKEVFLKTGLFDDSIKSGCEWDIMIDAAQYYYFDFVNEPLFNYYLHENQMIKTIPINEQNKDFEFVLEKHENLYSKYPKAKGIIFRHLGTLNLLVGNNEKAKKYFIASIKTSPTPRNILTFLLSLLGRDIYKMVLSVKRRLLLKTISQNAPPKSFSSHSNI